MLTIDTYRRGLVNAGRTAFDLLKIIIPVYAVVTVLKHTPAMEWLAGLFQPFMGAVGLPGEAALALVIAWFVSVYTSIGVIMALHLTAWQITIMAVMITFAHELLVETAVIKKTGVSVFPILATRIIGSIGLAMLLNYIHGIVY